MAQRVESRRHHEATPFALCHRIEALAMARVRPVLHLDEDRRHAVLGDDVDFPTPAAEVPPEDPEAGLLQKPARGIFAAAPAVAAGLQRARRQRVPFAVSSSTMPIASSSLRALSARGKSRAFRAA